MPDLSDHDRDDLVSKLVPFACEAADSLWLKHMLDRDSAGEHEGRLRTVFLLPSRWDPRVTGYSGMPALGSGIIGRLKDAGWHDIIFSDLVEYERFRGELASGALAPPGAKESLLDWYLSLMLRFPRVSRAARFVLTIPFSNTNVRYNFGASHCSFRHSTMLSHRRLSVTSASKSHWSPHGRSSRVQTTSIAPCSSLATRNTSILSSWALLCLVLITSRSSSHALVRLGADTHASLVVLAVSAVARPTQAVLLIFLKTIPLRAAKMVPARRVTPSQTRSRMMIPEFPAIVMTAGARMTRRGSASALAAPMCVCGCVRVFFCVIPIGLSSLSN